MMLIRSDGGSRDDGQDEDPLPRGLQFQAGQRGTPVERLD